MFNKLLLTLISTLITGIGVTFSQTTLTLQPDAAAGKDAYLPDLNPGTNYGTANEFVALAWTNSGTTVICRSIVEFDLSSIPPNAIINSATLYLYHNPSSANTSAQHQSLTGSNASVIQRIITAWDEMTVNFNNQPSTTTQNEVLIPQTTSATQDFIIDVSAMVQDMVDNPSTAHGFMFKLQTEDIYRSVICSSSDDPDPSNHPKLEVVYTDVTGIEEPVKSNILISPNPASDFVTLNGQINSTYKIYDLTGKVVLKSNSNSATHTINIADLKNGAYIIRISTENGITTRRLIKQTH